MEFISTDPSERYLEDVIKENKDVVYAFLKVLEVAARSNRVSMLLEDLNTFITAENERVKLDNLWNKNSKMED